MQRYEKNRIDTRPLSDIAKSMTAAERYVLEQELEKACITRMSLYRWITGRTTPQPSNKAILVAAFKKMGIITKPETLFPEINK